MHKEEIYNLPAYYDIAFSWDITEEVKFLLQLLKEKVPFDVTTLLEPACGSGRYLVELPKFKTFQKIVGYDISSGMVNYCNNTVVEKGLQDSILIVQGDMKSARFEHTFDVAINLINSIGYITEDEDIIQHFKNTGENLKKDGLYIIQLNCAYSKLPEDSAEWAIDRDGTKVIMNWSIDKEDKKKKLSYQSSVMQVIDQDKTFNVEDEHVMRLWLYDDLKELIRKSGIFELDSIYDERFNEVDMNREVIGEMGNLYFVLRRV